MEWSEAVRRIGNGEPAEDVLDEMHAADDTRFREWLGQQPDGDKHLVSYDRRMRDLNLGITGARGCWAALSGAQRRVLETMVRDGTSLRKDGSGTYFYTGHAQGYAIKGPRYPTVRNLCERELLAWDGGAFDPAAAAALTERGRFVVQHGASASHP